MNRKLVTLSVIIPAYNEEKYIERCLVSLKNQMTDTPFEIIVVNNGSTDATGKISGRYADQVYTIHTKSYVAALNAGAHRASGSILVFTDADTDHPPHWIDRIAQTFRKFPDIVACGGPCYFYDGPYFMKILAGIYAKWGSCLGQILPIGANIAVRKNIYFLSGGFPSHTELQTDRAFALTLRKYGYVAYKKNLSITMSGRRFYSTKKILLEGYQRCINIISLFFTGSTIYKQFDDIRT